jgi:hypothetical protein
MTRATVGPKFTSEVKDIIFDFSDDIGPTDSIASATLVASVLSGVDATPTTILTGSPVCSGFGVTQRVSAGVRGVKYKLHVTATAVGGTVHVQEVEMGVV